MRKAVIISLFITLSAGCSTVQQPSSSLISVQAPLGKTEVETIEPVIPVSDKWQVSPTFDIYEKRKDTLIGYTMRGIKEKVAYKEAPIIAEKSGVYTWYSWNSENEWIGKELKITATNVEKTHSLTLVDKNKIEKQTGPLYLQEDEKPKILPLTNQDSSTKNIFMNNPGLPSARSLTNMNIPKAGIWKLDIYVNNKKIESVVVSVKKKEEKVQQLGAKE